MSYSVIVFDTAPTGHTLRLLQFPSTLEKGLSKLMGLRGMFGGMMESMASMMGAGTGREGLLGKLEELKVHLNSIWKTGIAVTPLLGSRSKRHQDLQVFTVCLTGMASNKLECFWINIRLTYFPFILFMLSIADSKCRLSARVQPALPQAF